MPLGDVAIENHVHVVEEHSACELAREPLDLREAPRFEIGRERALEVRALGRGGSLPGRFGTAVTVAGLWILLSSAVIVIAGPVAGHIGRLYGSRLPLVAGTVLTTLPFFFTVMVCLYAL